MVCSELFEARLLEARLLGRSQLRGFRAQDDGPASPGVFANWLMFAVLRGSEVARLGSKFGK